MSHNLGIDLIGAATNNAASKGPKDMGEIAFGSKMTIDLIRSMALSIFREPENRKEEFCTSTFIPQSW